MSTKKVNLLFLNLMVLSVAFGFSEKSDLDDSGILHLLFFSSRTNLKCNISAHLKLVEKLIT